MALQEIPVSGDTNELFATILDSKLFYISLRWNSYAEMFYMSVFDADRNPIVGTLPIVGNRPVGNEFAGRYPNFPNGFFYAYDTTESGLMPDPDNFGTTVKLLFQDFTS